MYTVIRYTCTYDKKIGVGEIALMFLVSPPGAEQPRMAASY
jgi:hypothetical protein